MAATALEVAERVRAQGIGVTVVDPRWAKPLDPALPGAGGRATSWWSPSRTAAVPAAAARPWRPQLRDAAVDVPLCDFALPQEFLAHGSREQILVEAGLSAQVLARRVVEAVARREPGLVQDPRQQPYRLDVDACGRWAISGLAEPRAVGGEHLRGRRQLDGRAEQVALPVPAAEVDHRLTLAGGLDALGDRVEAEQLAQPDDGSGQRRARSTSCRPAPRTTLSTLRMSTGSRSR